MVVRMDRRIKRIFSVAIIFMLLIGSIIVERSRTFETSMMRGAAKLNNYKIDVIYDDKNKRLVCNQTTEFVNNSSSTLDKIYFHIYPNAFSNKNLVPFEKGDMLKAYPNGFDKGYIDIKNILNSNNKLRYNVKGKKSDILEIFINKKLKPGESMPIDFKYNIKLPNCSGRFGYGKETINVTNWFPIACVHDKRGWSLNTYETIGDPFYSDTSNFKVRLLIPRNYVLANTGDVTKDKQDDKQKMYYIEANNVRDFAFIMSKKFNINRANSKGISINTYNLNKNMSHKSTEIAKDSIDIYNSLFGKYPYKQFSVVASNFYIGGMEYPMMVMIDKNLYNEKDKFLMEYVIAHETAHQWWYSVIGNNEVKEPWLDEALTEYSTVLYFENKYGKVLANRLLYTMDKQSKGYKEKSIFGESSDYKDSTDYSLSVYTKGALAIDKIRKKVGDKVFFATLKQYYKDNMYKNVNTQDFISLWKSKGIDVNKIIGYK